jgi:predicted GIY-YIG superfamily endonuclease
MGARYEISAELCSPASKSRLFFHPLGGPSCAYLITMQGTGGRFVYILRSEPDPSHYYVGRTTDVVQRLEWHNHGPCGHTTRHRPWRVIVVIEFPDGSAAAAFERYLKSGSGRAFAKRHFAPR